MRWILFFDLIDMFLILLILFKDGATTHRLDSSTATPFHPTSGMFMLKQHLNYCVVIYNSINFYNDGTLIVWTLTIVGCYDSRPADYDTSAASYCRWTCQDWAKAGYCNYKWNVWACTVSSKNIKTYCKVSCNNCGKYLIDV